MFNYTNIDTYRNSFRILLPAGFWIKSHTKVCKKSCSLIYQRIEVPIDEIDLFKRRLRKLNHCVYCGSQLKDMSRNFQHQEIKSSYACIECCIQADFIVGRPRRVPIQCPNCNQPMKQGSVSDQLLKLKQWKYRIK